MPRLASIITYLDILMKNSTKVKEEKYFIYSFVIGTIKKQNIAFIKKTNDVQCSLFRKIALNALEKEITLNTKQL